MVDVGTLYFAYGCNMDPGQLARVTGIDVGPGWPARAPGWLLTFDKLEEDGSVVANLERAGGDCLAYGVAYRLPWRGLAALDRYEGAPEHYRRETLWIEPIHRYARQAAITYLAQPRWVGEAGVPANDYAELVLRGARSHGLPPAYIDWLWAVARGQEPGPFREG